MQYPGKLYSADGHFVRVVFGHDEHQLAKKEGWLDEPPKRSAPTTAPSSSTLEHSTDPEKPKRGRPPKSQEVSLGAGQ